MANSNPMYDSDVGGWVVVTDSAGNWRPATSDEVGSASNGGGGGSSQAPTTSQAPASGRSAENPPNLVSSVAQLYRDAFGREADTAGLQYWQQQAASGKYADLAALNAAFVRGQRGDDIAAYSDQAKYNSAWNNGLDPNSGDLYYNADHDSWFMLQQRQPQQPQIPGAGGGVVGQQPPVGGGGAIGGGGVIGGGGIVGGIVVNDGTSLNNGNMGGVGNSGVVYGPDGKPYSSVAAAVAAGVTNYSFVKPGLPGGGLIKGADNLVNIPNAATGNANPGGLIANQQQQMVKLPTGVQLPPGVSNPFAL